MRWMRHALQNAPPGIAAWIGCFRIHVFRGNEVTRNLYLGIDGGGSKTAGVILDAEGRTVAALTVAGVAMHGAPTAEELLVLSELVDSLCRQAGCTQESIRYCGAGLSGMDFADEHATQLLEISCAIGLPSERITLVNDAIVALWGATLEPAAALVQHGSGFTAAYRTHHGAETLFDHLNRGRIFDVRMELVVNVARMIDGRVEPTPLKEATLSHLGIVDECNFCEAMFRQQIPWPLLAASVPMIYSAWEAGDPVATTLVHCAADDYALTAKAMIARTGSNHAKAVFGGGVIQQAPPAFWKLLTQPVTATYSQTDVAPPCLKPEFGAAIMAAFQDGHDPQAYFRRVLAETAP